VAVKYVSSAASGSDDGTSPTHTGGTTGPWTFAQMLAATPAAGDEIRVMADGVYSRAATGTIGYANGTGAANILVTGANSSGVVDGSRPTIRATAASITLLSVTGNSVRVEQLTVDGNAQTGTIGLDLNATYASCRLVKATNCKSKGLSIQAGNAVWGERLEATGCSGTAGIYLSGPAKVYYSESHGNTCTGFLQDSPSSVCVRCLSYANTGGSSRGFDLGSVGYQLVDCTAQGNGSHGFALTGNAALGAFLANCLAYGNGGEGFGSDGVKSGARLLNCAGGNNTSGNYSATNLPNVEGFVALTADPFTNAAGGDFSLNSAAGGGAACRGAGFPGAFPAGTTTGYLDVGAVEHQDAGGGGTTTVVVAGRRRRVR
jgi:hypothetical protein